MKLKVVVDERVHEIDVRSEVLEEGEAFFAKLDHDMDQGWQMSREFVEAPTTEQRCQIVADRVLGAMTAGNEAVAQLMAGYILTRMPDVVAVDVDTSGEIQNTRFERSEGQVKIRKLSDDAAREQAEKDVSPVYKIGRVYRYATFDHLSKTWVDSPAVDSEERANTLREDEVARRAEEWSRTGIRVLEG